MNPPKVDELDYIHFLIAAQQVFTCTEAARCQPESPKATAHDAFIRLLSRQPRNTEALWQQAQSVVDKERGLLVVDDTTLDKPYASKMELMTYHWSGKHQRVVPGIAWITLLGTDGEATIPCDFRVDDAPLGGSTKNEPFRAMLQTAKERGFAPAYVLMDSWYSGLANLKLIAHLGWFFLTRLKSNRQVNPDGQGNVPVSEVEILPEGRVVHRRGFGFVRVFRMVSKDGGVQYWATNDLGLTGQERERLEQAGWRIEEYHRGIKQCCGVERAQVRQGVAMQGHLVLALRAFLRLEVYRLRAGVSGYEAKRAIVREAVRSYLANPVYELVPTA